MKLLLAFGYVAARGQGLLCRAPQLVFVVTSASEFCDKIQDRGLYLLHVANMCYVGVVL